MWSLQLSPFLGEMCQRERPQIHRLYVWNNNVLLCWRFQFAGGYLFSKITLFWIWNELPSVQDKSGIKSGIYLLWKMNFYCFLIKLFVFPKHGHITLCFKRTHTKVAMAKKIKRLIAAVFFHYWITITCPALCHCTEMAILVEAGLCFHVSDLSLHDWLSDYWWWNYPRAAGQIQNAQIYKMQGRW